MHIGHLARRTGISRDSIRFYERQGLIASSAGAAETNNYRDYPEEAVSTIKLISMAQAAGLTIADLIVILAQISKPDLDDFDGIAFLQTKISEVEARIATSQTFLETLKTTLTALERAPFGPDHSGPDQSPPT